MNAVFRSVIYTGLFAISAIFASTGMAQSHAGGCKSGACYPKVGYGGYQYVPASHLGYGYIARPQIVTPVILHHRFGTAEIIRARGEANLNNAHARTQHLKADRILMENSVEILHTRLKRKEINRRERFGHLHERAERIREAERRAEEAELRDAIPGPEAADVAVVERGSGQVNWPLLLRTSHFEKARGPVDQVFRERSLKGAVNPDHYLPLCDWIEKIEKELLANSNRYLLADYLEAKSFLRNLIAEARIDLDPPFSGTQLAIH